MLSCYLQGGLGNQLFQIFTTINYSLKYKKPFAFTNQKQLDIQRSTYWQTLLQPLARFTRQINYKQTNKDKFSTLVYKTSTANDFFYLREKDFSYNDLPSISNDSISNDSISNENENILLVGYFQSYKYFTEYSNSIVKLIKIEEQQQKTKITFNKYNISNTISLHFRRGDYKYLQDHYILLDYTYYDNALRYILAQQKTHERLNALVFCEKNDVIEILSITDKLKRTYPTVTFEIVDFNINDWQQLLLMSVCKHNIIANSTFSWWGAYFNTNPERIVCYPDRWFGIKQKSINNTKDLFPPGWKEIKTVLF
jgi:hypothetical protein